MTLTFSDGTVQSAALFHRPGSYSGGENTIHANPPAQPSIAIPGITTQQRSSPPIRLSGSAPKRRQGSPLSRGSWSL
ncbi:MAG: hypothetical protein R2867_30605 [Caldilineaceae bacterium]